MRFATNSYKGTPTANEGFEITFFKQHETSTGSIGVTRNKLHYMLKMFGEGVSKYTYVLKSSLAILIHRSNEVYINEVAVILQNVIGVLENSPIVRKPK